MRWSNIEGSPANGTRRSIAGRLPDVETAGSSWNPQNTLQSTNKSLKIDQFDQVARSAFTSIRVKMNALRLSGERVLPNEESRNRVFNDPSSSWVNFLALHRMLTKIISVGFFFFLKHNRTLQLLDEVRTLTRCNWCTQLHTVIRRPYPDRHWSFERNCPRI